MGNDSGIKRKHKRRTAIHKKHQVFPGMKLNPEATIVSGSIRHPKATPQLTKDVSPKRPQSNVDLWDKYDKAVKQLSVFAGSQPLQSRTNVEFSYYLAYKALVRTGEISRVKRKYLGGRR